MPNDGLQPRQFLLGSLFPRRNYESVRISWGESRCSPKRHTSTPSPKNGDVDRLLVVPLGRRHRLFLLNFFERPCAHLAVAHIADYDEALRLDANNASSLYGRGFAKPRKGDASGAADDIAAATAIQADIAAKFAEVLK